jgi:hypothetical protein
MTGDEYLQSILAREAVDTGPYSAGRTLLATLMPAIGQWAGIYLAAVACGAPAALALSVVTGYGTERSWNADVAR